MGWEQQPMLIGQLLPAGPFVKFWGLGDREQGDIRLVIPLKNYVGTSNPGEKSAPDSLRDGQCQRRLRRRTQRRL